MIPTRTTDPATTTELDRRLARLELTNRLYRWTVLATITAALVAVPVLSSHADRGGGKDASFDTVSAQRVAIMSEDGKQVRMLLSGRGGMAKVSLHGPAGKPRLTLSVDEKGAPMVSLNGPDGKPRLTLVSQEATGSHIIAYDRQGKVVLKQP